MMDLIPCFLLAKMRFWLFKANKRIRDLKLAFKSEDRAEVIPKFGKRIKVDQDFRIGTTASRFQ